MAKPYTPSKKILEKYADVMINFALGNGKGIKKGDVVRVTVAESAKPLYFELQKAVIKAGGHVLPRYLPDDDENYNFAKMFYDNASNEQILFTPKALQKATVDTVDHSIYILSETDKSALKGVDPKKIMLSQTTSKYMKGLLDVKENAKKFTWTLAMYGTPQMAKEVKMSEKEYWEQIIKACYLNHPNPIAKWKDTYKKIDKYKDALNKLSIEKMHIEGKDVDLWIKLTPKSQWKSGSGCNIPSFEIFTSPDWRGTEGWIRFSEPLYRYGNLITGIQLWFKNGLVVKSSATKNHAVLKEMIAQKNADKVGEYSLTDRRFSEITKFMGETLFDENVGGRFGNTHLALGNAYQDCYKGDPAKVSKKEWEKLGYNESVIHTDIVSTTDRTVTAYYGGGKKKIIYKDGQFVL